MTIRSSRQLIFLVTTGAGGSTGSEPGSGSTGSAPDHRKVVPSREVLGRVFPEDGGFLTESPISSNGDDNVISRTTTKSKNTQIGLPLRRLSGHPTPSHGRAIRLVRARVKCRGCRSVVQFHAPYPGSPGCGSLRRRRLRGRLRRRRGVRPCAEIFGAGRFFLGFSLYFAVSVGELSPVEAEERRVSLKESSEIRLTGRY